MIKASAMEELILGTNDMKVRIKTWWKLTVMIIDKYENWSCKNGPFIVLYRMILVLDQLN